MPGGTRRLPRTVRSTVSPAVVPLVSGDMTSNKYSPLNTSTSTLTGFEQPPAPKHFPFPNTPIDNELIFEFLMFLYITIGAGLQFLQLYRSVWWLPHSYNSSAVNFYLIDGHLVAFIMVILSRRIVYLLGCKALEYWVAPKQYDFSCYCYRAVLFSFMATSLPWCAYCIIQNHPLVNIFYLCYPVSVYGILFGFTTTPFFELITWNSDGLPPLHACTSNAKDIRAEIESLKGNFNGRMKQIMFNSVLNAYYAGLVPCCFAQNFVYYDTQWATVIVVSLWLSCFTAYAIHILPLRYCDTLHRSAVHLGSWEKVETRSHLPVTHVWQEDILWPCGVLIRYGRDIYRGKGETNAAEPGNAIYARFYGIFSNPSKLLGLLLVVHVFVIMVQFLFLLKSYYYWYNTITMSLLLLFNYCTLFKVARDYLISKKIYKAEQTMRTKVTDN